MANRFRGARRGLAIPLGALPEGKRYRVLGFADPTMPEDVFLPWKAVMSADMVRLELVEQGAWRQLAAAAPPPFAREIGLECRAIGRTLFHMASRIPAFQFNWLAGAGLEGDDSGAVVEAKARFAEAGQTKYFIQNPPGPFAETIAAAARNEGLIEHPLAWAKFVRATTDAPKGDANLIVREINPAERDIFASTAVAGFGMPAPMAIWLTGIVGRPHWHCYVSFVDEEPAGAGALFVEGDYAWLGIGSTKPQMRKRGGQSALLARRIADAHRLGARWAVTETGVPQPGQPAPSYKNILAAGFSVAYVRPNWALPV